MRRRERSRIMRFILAQFVVRCGPRLAVARRSRHDGRPGRTKRRTKRCDVMNVRTTILGLLLCVTAMPAGAGERERLTIRVSPAVSFAPANLVVRATIAADAENRTV